MIPTNTQLPIHGTPMDPLHDECSGLANLKARNATRGGGVIVAVTLSGAFAFGMLAGAAIVAGLFIAANHFQH